MISIGSWKERDGTSGCGPESHAKLRNARDYLASLLTLLWLPLPLILLCLLSPCPTSAQQPSQTPTPAPARTGKSYSSGCPANAPPAPRPQAQSPVTFSDITRESNINFRHEASSTSSKYLIEAMGGGVSMFDYDNDGRMDLFFTNGALLKDPMPKGQAPDNRDPKYWNRLYHQKKSCPFEE